MTDKDKLIELFKSFGLKQIDVDLREGNDNYRRYVKADAFRVLIDKNGCTVVTLGEGAEGYSGFFCDFDFDETGKFIEHCCGE